MGDGGHRTACEVDSCTAPAVSERTQRCESHQRQFEKLSSQYSTLLHRHNLDRKDPRHRHPGDKTAFINARYTDHPDVYTWLSPTDRHALRELINRASREEMYIADLPKRLLTNRTSPQEAAATITKYLLWVDQLLTELKVIASEPEDLEQALNGAPKPKPPRKSSPKSGAVKKRPAKKGATSKTTKPSKPASGAT